MSNAVAEAPQVKEAIVTAEDRFLFDLQGFLLLKNVLSADEVGRYLAIVRELEANPPDDDARREALNTTGRPGQPTRDKKPTSIRMNGLLRMDTAFDALIAHPAVAPLLEEFVDVPQLCNTWSISKWKGEDAGGWHRGVAPYQYSCRNGRARTAMLNVIWFLTDNGPEDGSLIALPGGHKSNLDLQWGDYKGSALPGSRVITGKAGDVFMFSEAVLHTGIPKTTAGCRTNLYYNYVAQNYNVMTYSPEHNYHFAMPPSVRARFDEKQRKFTEWMEFVRTIE